MFLNTTFEVQELYKIGQLMIVDQKHSLAAIGGAVLLHW